MKMIVLIIVGLLIPVLAGIGIIDILHAETEDPIIIPKENSRTSVEYYSCDDIGFFMSWCEV